MTVEAVTDEGKAFLEAKFGIGAVSVEIRKSQVEAFASFASEAGVMAA